MRARIRGFLGFETIAFAVAATVHFWVAGDNSAGTAESVIAAVLLLGLVASWIRPASTRIAGIATQIFALLGTMIGTFLVVVGIGPQTVPDIIYHFAMLVVLVWGIIVAWRAPTDGGSESWEGS